MHAHSKLEISVALCWVKKLHITFLGWPFIVPSTRCTCSIIITFNQFLDMPHLSGGWIILAKDTCSLTGMQTNLCTTFERHKLFVHMEHFWDILFQLIKHGTKTLHCIYIFVQYSLSSCFIGTLTLQVCLYAGFEYSHQATEQWELVMMHREQLCIWRDVLKLCVLRCVVCHEHVSNDVVFVLVL